MRNEYSRTKRQNDTNHEALLPNYELSANLMIIYLTWQKKWDYKRKTLNNLFIWSFMIFAYLQIYVKLAFSKFTQKEM